MGKKDKGDRGKQLKFAVTLTLATLCQTGG